MTRTSIVVLIAACVVGSTVSALGQGGGGGGGAGGAGGGGAGGASAGASSSSGTSSSGSATNGANSPVAMDYVTDGTGNYILDSTGAKLTTTGPAANQSNQSNRQSGAVTSNRSAIAPTQISPNSPQRRAQQAGRNAGAGRSANGLPIGSPGSGPGSPEQPR